jgi:uncharacterized protein
MHQDLSPKLEQRLGRVHARQRLGIEKDYEQRVFGHGTNVFHIENCYSQLTEAGRFVLARVQNAERVQIRHNFIQRAEIPTLFNGFTILHISDMHAGISQGAMRRLIELLHGISYDLCVLTGDYRGKTFGPFDAALQGAAQVSCLENKNGSQTVYSLGGVRKRGELRISRKLKAVVAEVTC